MSPSVSTGNRDLCVPPKIVAETSVALTKKCAIVGRAEARPHARGSRLDVHTELTIVCLRGSVPTYIQNWQLFVYAGAPLGSDIAGMLAPLGNCLSTWKPLWGPIYTERKKKRRVNFIPKFHSSLKKFVKYFTMITKRYMYGTKVPNFIGL